MFFSAKATRKFKAAVMGGAMLLAVGGVTPAGAGAAEVAGKWMSGDFHQHTTYTDGSTNFFYAMQKNYEYDLDWWSNSEHGGGRVTDGLGRYWDDTTDDGDPPYNTVYPKNPIQGDYAASGGHQVMWRWQSVRDFAYADVLKTRSIYYGNKIFSGLEWNVPGHEHCSVSVVALNSDAISAFEYSFDKADDDTSRNREVTPYGTLVKHNGRTYTWPGGVKSAENKSWSERHLDSVRACRWMENQYKAGNIDDAWIIFAHVERAGAWSEENGGGYNVEHFRDFNNAAPDICYGFEGVPGHQAGSVRGEFSPSAAGGGTYGGAGIYTAQVGGLWDALLGEGRHWFNFANSDYHAHYTIGGVDFFPGEYQKNWMYVKDLDGDGKYSLQEIAAAQRGGNSFLVDGDLINALDFSAWINPNRPAVMGQNLIIPASLNRPVTIQVRFKSPAMNHNGDTPVVDHIDLIAGDITGKIASSDANYTNATNTSTAVVARFTSKDWKVDAEGYNVITYRTNLSKSTYFRLRGTNVAVGTTDETDADGNPIIDTVPIANGVDPLVEAWSDLWFYSNPIFVYVR